MDPEDIFNAVYHSDTGGYINIGKFNNSYKDHTKTIKKSQRN